FLIFLSKDQQTINKILSNATTIYQHEKRCDLNKDVMFLNKMFQADFHLRLDVGDSEKRRIQSLKAKDEDEITSGENIKTNREGGRKEEDNVSQFAVAMRFIDVLGQIMRSFPGSLK